MGHNNKGYLCSLGFCERYHLLHALIQAIRVTIPSVLFVSTNRHYVVPKFVPRHRRNGAECLLSCEIGLYHVVARLSDASVEQIEQWIMNNRLNTMRSIGKGILIILIEINSKHHV